MFGGGRAGERTLGARIVVVTEQRTWFSTSVPPKDRQQGNKNFVNRQADVGKVKLDMLTLDR